MKQASLLVLIGVLFYSNNIFSQCGQLVWQDEFNTASVDNTKWTVQTGNGCPSLCGWGNNEAQTYSASSNNVRMDNGNLIIEARNNAGAITSGRLTTQGKFSRKYGRYEVRAKLPSGTGLWPAFWMLSDNGNWPNTGEIDIMEYRGDIINRNTGTLHYGDFVPNNLNDGTNYILPSGTFTDNFHVFAVEWELGVIRWYVDGTLYKTETKTPNTLNPASNNDPWPWDGSNFYIILNLAVGSATTPFTGNQAPNFGTSGKMEVDYVRVYDAAQPQVNFTGKVRVFQNTTAQYSIPAAANQTYSWTVPTGASITAGQNTNQITVNWGTSAGGDVRVDVQHNAGALCPGKTFFYTKAVNVYKNNCSFTFNNYEGVSTMSSGYVSGQLYENNNPGANAVNNSPRVGRYVRNPSELYDAFYYDYALLDNGTEYTGGTYRIKMDIYTSAASGTPISLQLGSMQYWGAYPAGVHSAYSATTTAVNQWHTVTFTYVNSPDGGGATYRAALDRMVFLFQPNTNSGATFYIDNIRRELAVAPPTLTINGPQAVAVNQTGVGYEAVGGNPAHTYLWSTPVGSTIVSGINTDTIGVNYGSLGGQIAVQERMNSGCYGPVALKSISVGGNSCALFSDEYDNTNTSGWIANSAGNGFTHSEVISDWKINSPGHGEWDYTEYTINDGTGAVLLDFTNPLNNPVLKIRARATSQMFMRVTLVDNSGKVAANQYLNPLNGLVVSTTSQEYSIDFNGQFWDEYGGGGVLDNSKIAKIRISLNPGFASFPAPKPGGGTFNSSFVGDVFIDYIRIGNDCPTAIANFNASDLVLCATGTPVTFTDNSANTSGATTYAWNFGAGATPATSATKGPHSVSYSTPGWKTVTLNLDGGASTRTRTDYIYVSPSNTGCVFQDEYNDASVSSLTTAQGNFTLTESASQFHISTSAHGEWETFSQGFNSGAVIMPIDFSCGFLPTVKVRAKASSPVALRVNMVDKNAVQTNNAATTAQTMELTTSFQEFTLSFQKRFTDQYAAGGPFNVDSTDVRKLLFSLNPGFASFPWTGPNHGSYNASFNGTVDIDYVLVGNCTSPLPVELLNFSGVQNQNGALLKWNTYGNIYQYQVQKLKGGYWSTIATLSAEENSFLDANITGVEMYRLQMTDTDGITTYSVAIKVGGQQAATWSIYPVPAQDELIVQSNEVNVRYRLLNSFGEILISQEGNYFDLKNIPTGTYLIQLIGENVWETKMFVKN